MKKGRATPPGQPTIKRSATAEEIAAAKSFAKDEEEKRLDNEYRVKREEEYIKKGWQTPFDLLDDIIERGIDTVKLDRTAIKQKHKKRVKAKK